MKQLLLLCFQLLTSKYHVLLTWEKACIFKYKSDNPRSQTGRFTIGTNSKCHEAAFVLQKRTSGAKVEVSKVCVPLAGEPLLESLTCSLPVIPRVTGAGRAPAPCPVATATGNKVSPFTKSSVSGRQGALSVCRIQLNDINPNGIAASF